MSAPLSQEKAADLLRAVEGVLAEFGILHPGSVFDRLEFEDSKKKGKK